MKNALLVLLGFIVLSSPLSVSAQFTYTTNNGAITITGYTDSGGAVTIPTTINDLPVRAIGDSAFQNKVNVTSVTISGSATSIGIDAFADCTSLTGVTTLGSITSIGDYAFYGCSSLISVTLPGSASSMGNYVFSYCTSLTNATIPGSITSVGDEAFEFCTSLTSVNIPNAVTSIGYYAFGGCSSLTSVAIPGRVTTIGDAAFAACTSLTNVTIGGGVTNVGFEALDSCTSLIAITVDATNDSFSSLDGVLLNKSQNTLIAFPGGKAGGYSIPGTVTSIGDGAFVGSTGLTSITISGSLTNIGYLAFQSCTSLTSVTIVKGGINIGVGAFDSCGNLTAVFFQGNAPSVVGSQAFERSSAILYYLPGTSGWGATLDSRPTRLWNPLIQSSGVSSAGFGFNITGTADIPMVIEAAANLANRTWIPLQSLNLTNGAFYFSDPNWTNYPARFYRVRSP